MFDTIIGLFKAGLQLGANFLGFQSKKLDLKNAQDVKDAAMRQDEIAAADKTAKAIANKDVNEIQKELAE